MLIGMEKERVPMEAGSMAADTRYIVVIYDALEGCIAFRVAYNCAQGCIRDRTNHARCFQVKPLPGLSTMIR